MFIEYDICMAGIGDVLVEVTYIVYYICICLEPGEVSILCWLIYYPLAHHQVYLKCATDNARSFPTEITSAIISSFSFPLRLFSANYMSITDTESPPSA